MYAPFKYHLNNAKFHAKTLVERVLSMGRRCRQECCSQAITSFRIEEKGIYCKRCYVLAAVFVADHKTHDYWQLVGNGGWTPMVAAAAGFPGIQSFGFSSSPFFPY